MKKMAFFILLLSAFSSSSFANEIVKMAIGDWPPYTSETDMKGKLLEKVVTEAFKLEGIDVTYKYFPWRRSYKSVLSGRYDGTFPWNNTETRNKDFYFNKIFLIKDEGVYFHLKSKKFEWNTIEDLKKYKVGVTLSFKQVKIYKENGITAYPVPSEELNFKKMLVGRIDVYETSKIIGYTIINKLFTPEKAKLFTNDPKPVEENIYYIMFSRKTPDGQHFADKFDSGLEKLKKSGEYDKILAQYIGVSGSR